MAVWFMRRLQCLLLANNSPCFTSKLPMAPEDRAHRQMVVETTCCARERAHALTHGGAIN
jgi:hypothetical protein